MIDEKTIEHAAQGYNPINDMLGEEARASFKHGVEWFKKALWHDTNEKPEGNVLILYQRLYDRDSIDFGIDGIFSDDEWAEYVTYNRVTKWCYIDDLLPKGGKK